jgi:hypothetical protein
MPEPVETPYLAPALAAWENEGGARGGEEDERALDHCVEAKVVTELPVHMA